MLLAVDLTKFMICIVMNYIRNCPNCNKEIHYTAQNNRNTAEKFQRFCANCSRIKMMNAPGYWDQIDKTKKKLSKMFTGNGNPNFGIPMSDSQKEKLRKNAKILRGKNNLSYGKSVYQWWTEKYGIEIANQKLKKTKQKWSRSASGKNNPMYGKPSPQGSGNGWSGWYKGWYFRSIHELSYMINVIEPTNLTWESAEQKKYAVPYINWNGEHKTYFADFVVNNDTLVECKPKRLHNSISVNLKKDGAVKFCNENGLTYKIECPPLITTDEMKCLCSNGTIKFLPRYEKMFLEKYGI